MANIVYTNTYLSDAVATSFNIELPAAVELQNGYHIVVYISQEVGTNAITSPDMSGASTGAPQTANISGSFQASSGGARGVFLVRQVDNAQTESRSYTFNGQNEDWIVTLWVVRGWASYPTFYTLRSDFLTTIATPTFTLPQLNTTGLGENLLVLAGITEDAATTDFRIYVDPNKYINDADNYLNGVIHWAGHTLQKQEGNTPDSLVVTQLPEGGNAWVFTAQNDGVTQALPPTCHDFCLDIMRHGPTRRYYNHIDTKTAINITQSTTGANFNLPPGHGLVDGDQLFCNSLTGGTGANISVSIVYVKGLVGDTCNLSSQGPAGANISTTSLLTASAFYLVTDKYWNMYDLATTVDGTNTSSVMRDFSIGTAFASNFETITTRSTSQDWEGRGFYFPQITDLSGDGIFTFRFNTAGNWTGTGVGTKGAMMVVRDVSGGWAAWNFAKKNTATSSQDLQVFVDLKNQPRFDQSISPPLDLSLANGYGCFIHKGTSATGKAFTLYHATFVKPQVWVGGGSIAPMNVGTFSEIWKPWITNVYGTFENTQAKVRLPIQIGDGITRAYFDGDLSSLVGAPSYDQNTTDSLRWMVPNERLNWKIKLSPNDTYSASPAIFSSPNIGNFVIDENSSISGTYSLDGYNLEGQRVDINNGFDIHGLNIYNSKGIYTKSTNFDGIFVSGTQITNGPAMVATDGGSLTNSTFEDITSYYTLELSGNGPANYNLINTDLGSPTVKQIFFSGTTGTWTVLLDQGQTVPTYDTSGVSVVWDQPIIQATASVVGILDGSRLRVYNETEESEVVNTVIVSGGNWTINYDNGTTFTNGDTVNIRLALVDGISGWKEFESTTVASVNGFTVLADQEADTVYNTWAIDGEAQTQYSPDGVNIDIDVSVPGSYTKKSIAAWWKWYLTTEDGIRTFWGAYTLENVNSIRQNVDRVDVLIQNISGGSTVLFTDNDVRYYRSNFSNPYDVQAGYGAIYMDYSGVPLVVTTTNTVSALTTDQNNKLNKINNNAGLIPALL